LCLPSIVGHYFDTTTKGFVVNKITKWLVEMSENIGQKKFILDVMNLP
jgi:hypothetical protein